MGKARAAHDETDTRAVEVLDALDDEAGGRRSELDDPERAEVKDVPLRRFGFGRWRESSEWPEDEAGCDLPGPDPGGVEGRLGRRKAGAGRTSVEWFRSSLRAVGMLSLGTAVRSASDAPTVDDLVGNCVRSGRRAALVGGAEYGLEDGFMVCGYAWPLRASTLMPRGCPRDWLLDHGDGDRPVSWSLFMAWRREIGGRQRCRWRRARRTERGRRRGRPTDSKWQESSGRSQVS